MNVACIATLMILAAVIMPGEALSQGKPVQPTFFGMHFHNTTGWDSRRQRTIIPSVPVGSWRIWDARARWAELQPARGTWRFETLDGIVELAIQRGIEPLMVLGSTPAWASARPTEFCVYGSSGCAAEPADLADWESYVRTLATRYKGRIRNWELWNEPKFSDFPQNFASAFFTGSTETMVKLAEIAHRVLKQVDSGNRLLTPGFTGSVRQIEHYLRAGGGKYADGFSVHFYVARPEATLNRWQEVRDIAERNGVGHLPIWNTEQNFEVLRGGVEPPGPHGFGVRNANVRSSYVLTSLILQASSQVERVYWHSWEGVFADDGGSPNALGRAYIALGTWLTGSVIGPCQQLPGNVTACEMQRGRQQAWLAWRSEGTAKVHIPAHWRIAAADALDGVTVNVDSDSVSLGSWPLLLRSKRGERWAPAALR